MPGSVARLPYTLAMAVLESRIDTRSEAFEDNARHHRALAEELRELAARIALGGDERSRERHIRRGKLLPRDRVRGLLDTGSPFLEIGQLAGHELYDDVIPAAGLVAGIGRVSGQECMVIANDATVKGGTYYPITVKKHLRAQEIATERITFVVPDAGAFADIVEAGGRVLAPMPGQVVSVAVSEGDRVRPGDVLLVVEAMNMEHEVRALAPGTVTAVRSAPGDRVEEGVELVSVDDG